MEEALKDESIWKDLDRSVRTNQELSELNDDMEFWSKAETEINELMQFKDLAETDEALRRDLERRIDILEKQVMKEELRTYLSGRYDKNNAIFTISSGAGGQDSQDWATMLLRMYERYFERKGYKAKILHQSYGDAGGPEGRIGTKSATLEVQSKYAYGYLKKENGVHRLVRISPFSSQDLRHTSFASVEVIPLLPKDIEKEIEIRPEDLRLDTYRASGPGGQHVNRRESAIRITHLPTGIQAASQSERLQGQNRETAMKVLYAKLFQLKEEEREKELVKIKGKKTSTSWGNQIRSYVLHPYKMAKDLRTGVETSNVEAVLDGDLDQFINAEIMLNK